MQHFGCSSWGCVQKVFGRGGLLAGLNGWLNVLLKAQDGDSVSALNYQALKSGGAALSTLSGVFMRGEGVGGIQVRLTGLVSPDGANSSISAVSNSNEFAHFAGNGAVYGSYALAGSGGAAAFGSNTYMRNACDTWDCTSLTLNGTSLLLSAGQTAAVTCGPACAGVAGYLTTIDASCPNSLVPDMICPMLDNTLQVKHVSLTRRLLLLQA